VWGIHFTKGTFSEIPRHARVFYSGCVNTILLPHQRVFDKRKEAGHVFSPCVMCFPDRRMLGRKGLRFGRRRRADQEIADAHLFIRMVVAIAVKSIPKYLHNSAFAKAIEDDDDTIDLPESCYKSDLTINSNTDLSLLLGTLRFWGVDIMPREVILYVIWRKPQEIINSTGDYVRELRYLPFLQALCAKAALSSGESASDYYGLNANVVWSTDPVEAAAQICLIHYEHANGDIWTTDTTALAARLGQHHALKFLHDNGCPWSVSTCSAAASNGHLSCLQYAHEQGCRWDGDTTVEAVKYRHLSCLQYACDNGCPVGIETLSWAILHTPCYTNLCEKGHVVLGAKLCASAADTNNIALLTSLHSQGCPWDKHTCEAAAQAGSLECLRFAHEHDCSWDGKTCSEAAQHGRLECLRYAVEHGCPIPADAILHAARHLPCLKYLHSKRVPWNEQVCERAAFWGNEDSVRYAHEHGCPWDARTCEVAANGDELVCLRYAHEHGCPWDARTVNAAAEYGQYRCLEYALAHHCSTDGLTCTKAAASSLVCLTLAHKHGCTWNSDTCAAAATTGRLTCLQYLHEQGCPWDAATTFAAVVVGKLECLKYAHDQGCPWVVSQLLAIPLTVKSRRCLEYVREQAPAEAAAYDARPLHAFAIFAGCAVTATQGQDQGKRSEDVDAKPLCPDESIKSQGGFDWKLFVVLLALAMCFELSVVCACYGCGLL
jgi:hypothetical protein